MSNKIDTTSGNNLEKRYGLIMAICMVVGSVIGSGIFFKAQKILICTGGRTGLGVLAWLVGGLIMISCACSFGIIAARKKDCNGIVDYAEELCGEKYGYTFGWFMATMFFPTQTAVIAWVTSKFLGAIFGWEYYSAQCILVAVLILVVAFLTNILSPVVAGKVQISTTVIKFIPLLFMAIFGTIAGAKSGMTVENFSYVAEDAGPLGGGMFTAICATAYAYEGWIYATTISSEMKNPTKDLPRALIFGSFIVIFIYVAYYIGLTGTTDNATLMTGGDDAVKGAFAALIPRFGGTGLFVMIVVSCYGALNGLMMATVRSFYSLAIKGKGYKPELFSQIGHRTKMPVYGGFASLILCVLWLIFYYGAWLDPQPWFGLFCFDVSEIPILTLYAMYLPLFYRLVLTCKGNVKIIIPVLAIFGSLFMLLASIVSHRLTIIVYLIIFAVIMIIGIPGNRKRQIDSV